MSDETLSFDGAVAERGTAKALLVHVDGKKLWVPKAQIHDDSEVWLPQHQGKLVLKVGWFTAKAFDVEQEEECG